VKEKKRLTPGLSIQGPVGTLLNWHVI